MAGTCQDGSSPPAHPPPPRPARVQVPQPPGSTGANGPLGARPAPCGIVSAMSTDAAARPRIVVGVDGSDGSKQALRWADHLARLTHARLDVVAVWEYHAVFNLTALPELEFPAADVERSLAETVDEVLGADR